MWAVFLVLLKPNGELSQNDIGACGVAKIDKVAFESL